jgi:hypothetical protein
LALFKSLHTLSWLPLTGYAATRRFQLLSILHFPINLWPTVCFKDRNYDTETGGFMNSKFLGLSSVLLLALGTLCAQAVPGQEYPSQSPSAQSPSAQPSTPPSQAPDTQAPPPSQAPDQTAPSQTAPSDQTGTASTTDSTAGTQTFTGTVVKQGDKFVLQDAASGKSYDIDHQDQVKQFEGKRVRVHGTLDAGSNVIHIQ